MRRVSTTLERLPQELDRFDQQFLERFGVELIKAAAVFLAAANVELSPVGEVGEDPHPGKLRASWRLGLDQPVYAGLPDQSSYPTPGKGDLATPIEPVSVGQSIHLTNDAATDGQDSYAAIIAVLGRHIDSRGRSIGSPQAPEGTLMPSLEELVKAQPQLVELAFQRALEGV